MRTDRLENKLTAIQTDIERQTQVGIQRQTQAERQTGRQAFRDRHRPEDRQAGSHS